MPLQSDIVGTTSNILAHDADARWLMAYAAALGDFNPRYLDTSANPVVAHPVFPVCPEWAVHLDADQSAIHDSLTPQERARAVHAAHDLRSYRPIKAGDRLTTQCTVVEVRAGKPGAVAIKRLDTTAADTGELVARTYHTRIYRGVAVEGGDRRCEDVPALPVVQPLDDAQCAAIDIPEGAAHTYTECARIWNPIHTDREIAQAAGLPDIILHGTATLALAVSRIVNDYADGDPTRITRLGGRFSAMVYMPSTIQLESQASGNVVSYQVKTQAGELAISRGFVCFDDAGSGSV